jgi:alkylhydroperoxidase family enzyme
MTFEMSGDRNIDKRMEQVVGKGLRVTPVEVESLTDEARELAVRIRAAFGIPEDGAMPLSLRIMLLHPELFKAQMAMGVALAAGTIPPRERELAVLRNAWLCGAAYEWGEHVRIAKERCGVTSEEIERCTQGAKAEGWSEHERAILKGVEELHADHALSDETWDVLARRWNEQQLMEFPVLVGAYIMTALQQNTLRTPLDPGNQGLADR